MTATRTLLRDPFVHFLALGALLFGVDRLRASPVSAEAPRPIVVPEVQVHAEHAALASRLRREPTRSELEAQLRLRVREQVLAERARELGLDRGDAIVERRLAQKIELLLETEIEEVEPAETDVRARALRSHRGAIYDLDLVRFADRSSAIEGVSAGMPARAGLAAPWGRRLHAPMTELRRRFGDVAEDWSDAPPGVWLAPVETRFGWVVARVREVRGNALSEADLNRAREALQAEAREAALANAAEAMAGRYEVQIQWP
ncbi:MAG: hypothetical protein AAGE52_09445 [Myxococcota bacterium]